MTDNDSEAPGAVPKTGRRTAGSGRAAPTIDLSEREFARESAGPPTRDEAAASHPHPQTRPGPDAATAPEAGPDTPAADAPPVGERPARAVPLFLPIAGAGILGGVVGALLAVFVGSSGPDPVVQASIDSRVSALAGRIDGLAGQIAEIGQRLDAAPAGADPAALSAIEERLGALEERPAAAPADLGPLESRIAALENEAAETNVGETAPSPEVAALTERVAALSGRLDTLEAEPPRDPATEAAAKTIALGALVDAADRGQPFANEIAQLRAIVGEDPALAALRPVAERGVPSKSYLAGQFPQVAQAILGAAARPDPGDGLIDRLAQSAKSLVEVRPVGPVPGDLPEAIVSRMEAAVRGGDLAAALAEREALAAPGQAASARWAESAAARVALDRDVAALRAKLSRG